MSYRPNSELVAVAWLGSMSGVLQSMVSTLLPRDNSTWATSGFITVGDGTGRGAAVIGGAPILNSQVRHPVLSIHTWAVNIGSAKPPWGLACSLAEKIVDSVFDEDNMRRTLTLPTGYQGARVNGATCTEPRRVPGDSGAYAHYSIDLNLYWVPLP